MTCKEIGGNILQLRRQKKMKQKDIAILLGVSNRAVSKWESGKSYPNMEHIAELAKIFGVSVDYIMRGEIDN